MAEGTGLLNRSDPANTSDVTGRNKTTNEDARESPSGVLALRLALLLEKHAELKQIVDRWESLPASIRAAIITMVESAKAGA